MRFRIEQTQDRTRALLLSSASEKAKAARRIYEESFAIGERRRRLEAVEQLVVLEEEKRAGCERFLEQAKRHLFNANGSEIGDVDMAWRNLKRARDALESAKTETKRTGAVVQMQGPLREVEERLIEAEKRWARTALCIRCIMPGHDVFAACCLQVVRRRR